jgi:hypothetical protein
MSATRVHRHVNAPRARDTDTFHGRFVELVPDERVVVVEFETADPALRGEMTRNG